MEPVINPWMFYFIDIAKGIKAISLFASCCVFIPFICGLGTMVRNREYGNDDEDYLRGKRTFKTTLVILIILLGIFIFIPSADTILKMVIAKNVTYDTVDAAKDVVVQVYNDILALFQK